MRPFILSDFIRHIESTFSVKEEKEGRFLLPHPFLTIVTCG